ncbi:MAG: hypothetical protein RLY86_1118 [Pseudomonadota bacterium]|jgi:tryptophan halogenase
MMQQHREPASDERIRHVVVVGGGSAGWITAARIAARNGAAGPDSPGVTVTLVESRTIGIIGVGEGTWPTMRNTLAQIGITETDFIRRCDAAFKQGAKFARWVDGTAADYYYHPLNPPQGFTRINLAPYWRRTRAPRGHSFSLSVDFQEAVCEAGRAPKTIATPEYKGIANYAYHLDAGKFADMLCEHATGKLGVVHVVGDVTHVRQGEDGSVTAIDLADGRRVEGDLFVDCTGFRSLLLGDTLGVPFLPKDDILFADNAVAMQVPYDRPDAPIACHTISTAQKAGWIWDIGLPTRRGVGYVYTSRYTSHEEAEATLRAHIGRVGEGVAARRIPIRAGHREVFWKKNVVAVGLSAGFLEPLEASALMLVETAADFLTDRLPETRSALPVLARQFNAAFRHHWDRIIEFLKLHYILSRRTDSAFWIDNRDPGSIPDALLDLMDLWRHHAPGPQDFPHQPEVFSWPSYQYVLYGMGFDAAYGDSPKAHREQDLADRCFTVAAQATARSLAELPPHRDLLDRIRTYGLQPV